MDGYTSFRIDMDLNLMPEPKIDKIKLNQMLRSGKPQVEIAQVFGVTESAISKAKKELNLNVVKNVALENAHRVVDKNLNAIEQLQKINDYANDLLDSLMKWQRGDVDAFHMLENQDTAKTESRDAQQIIKDMNIKAPQELMLKGHGGDSGSVKIANGNISMSLRHEGCSGIPGRGFDGHRRSEQGC